MSSNADLTANNWRAGHDLQAALVGAASNPLPRRRPLYVKGRSRKRSDSEVTALPFFNCPVHVMGSFQRFAVASWHEGLPSSAIRKHAHNTGLSQAVSHACKAVLLCKIGITGAAGILPFVLRRLLLTCSS